jgi:hypothetical protein
MFQFIAKLFRKKKHRATMERNEAKPRPVPRYRDHAPRRSEAARVIAEELLDNSEDIIDAMRRRNCASTSPMFIPIPFDSTPAPAPNYDAPLEAPESPAPSSDSYSCSSPYSSDTSSSSDSGSSSSDSGSSDGGGCSGGGD